jgi:CSLREA domain-containing protein
MPRLTSPKKTSRLARFLVAGLSASLLLAALSFSVHAFPTPAPLWLSYKGTGTSQTASDYYASLVASGIPVPDSLSGWLYQYGFDSGEDARAIYYNSADLGLGRDMHCRRNGADVACYVVNHGIYPGASKEFALNAAVNFQSTLAVVAMVYTSSLEGQPNDVSFFIYGDGQNLQALNPWALLDTQGEKYLPQLCLPCHGGYPTVSQTPQGEQVVQDSVTGASFLPFDTSSFAYSRHPGYTLFDQQEQFRLLNAMVRDTNPSAQIAQLIDGWYASSGGVNTPGAIPDRSFIPPNFQVSSTDRQLYLDVVKPYCRTCHVAQSFGLDSPAAFDTNARNLVYQYYLMPHSEKTNRDFWRGGAPPFLARNRGWSLEVTRPDDPTPDGCSTNGCSLREAVLAANADPDHSIITFQPGLAPILLGIAGEDDSSLAGDLDISANLVLLGNGSSQTVIDAAQLDRVFHVLNSADVVIQGVTIQGGYSWKGGGIYNEAGNLVLNSSVLRNHIATFGAGLANTDSTTTEINESAIYNNNAYAGGGIANTGGDLTITNSTISGNYASLIGGGFFTAPGDFNVPHSYLTHLTIATNYAPTGGGLYNNNSTVVVKNSIITGNQADEDQVDDCATPSGEAYIQRSTNLVGQNGSPNGCLWYDAVIPGSVDTVIDVNLTTPPGEIPAHALVPGGPAIDLIAVDLVQDYCGLSSIADLHNVARPLDGDNDGLYACDAGPLEYDPTRLTYLPLVVK